MPQKVTVMAGKDADFADDADRLILVSSGGGYGGSGGVTVSPGAVAVGSLGETVQLTAVVRDQDGTPVTGVDLEWSSADPSVAVVDSIGNVTSVNYGLTMITATLATVSGTAIILVEDPNNSSVSDRYILEMLFKATEGEDWSWKEGGLTDAPLDQWHGVTTDAGGHVTKLWLPYNNLRGTLPSLLGRLRNLEELVLYSNRLTGPIPPELGILTQLKDRTLSHNELSGPIPPELGNLTQLLRLRLHKNPDLKGLLPRSFIGLDVEALFVEDTGVCRQQDVVFLEWWRNIPGRNVNYCAPSQIERLALIELYDKMNGASWTNTAGWGDNGPLGDWFGVTVGNGRVTELSLPNNALKDSIPGEIVNFTELEVLNLANNSLAGALPGEISFLRELTTLRINGNADLGGILGRDLTKLAKLEVLHFGSTLICASPTPTFQTWYAGIGDVSGMLCNNPTERTGCLPDAIRPDSGGLRAAR
ncbi:MAG: Ig-like domain-containing protein [Bacteroidetes bacterium]|nr:Ig-like domain-containing protein [Bacteroidota bacterium]